MVYGTATGGAVYHSNVLLLDKGGIDLLRGVLILPHHDGVVILPQQQIVSFSAVGQDVLLKRQVIGWVCCAGFKIGHCVHGGRSFYLCLIHRLISSMGSSSRMASGHFAASRSVMVRIRVFPSSGGM